MKTDKENHSAKISRRRFIATSLTAACGLALGVNSRAMRARIMGGAESGDAAAAADGFTMWQLPSSVDTIGNSYVFRTKNGKIIVMDGGFEQEKKFLTDFLTKLGGEVEAWFISHPHRDHAGALSMIIDDKGSNLKIKHIYHSRITEKQIVADPDKTQHDRCHQFYASLDSGSIPVTDLQAPGETYEIDGVKVKVLSVAQHDLLNNCYNNSSMVLRLWDKYTSMVFLGDAGAECGDRVLAGRYGKELNCDYLQMAHHGQSGCRREFYNAINFHACLWPTPTFVWTNNQGGGFDTGNLTTMDTRRWMKAKGIKEQHVACLEGTYKKVSEPHKTYKYGQNEEAYLFLDKSTAHGCKVSAKVSGDTTIYTLTISAPTASVTLYPLPYALKGKSKAASYALTCDISNPSSKGSMTVSLQKGKDEAATTAGKAECGGSSASWAAKSVDISQSMKKTKWGKRDDFVKLTFSDADGATLKLRNIKLAPKA